MFRFGSGLPNESKCDPESRTEFFGIGCPMIRDFQFGMFLVWDRDVFGSRLREMRLGWDLREFENVCGCVSVNKNERQKREDWKT